jgi:hypothetical protein
MAGGVRATDFVPLSLLGAGREFVPDRSSRVRTTTATTATTIYQKVSIKQLVEMLVTEPVQGLLSFKIN